MKKVVVMLIGCLSFSTLAASNEISLDLGTDFISGYPGKNNDTGVGLSGQLGYQYNLNQNVAFYTGIASGDDGISAISSIIVVGIFTDGLAQAPSQSNAYTTIPLAVQLSYPLGNNILFVRGGGNVYWTAHDDIYDPSTQESYSESHKGIGAYGAVGWRYYFGEEHNWGIGLTYQYIGLDHSFYSQVGSMTFSYRF